MTTTTLLCTVGGSHQPIVRAIEHLRPDHVCFICSDDDPATGNKGSYTQVEGKGSVIKARFQDEKPSLPNIPTQADLQPDQVSVLRVQADNLDDIYRTVTDWLGEQRHAYDESALILEKIEPPSNPKLRGEYERAIDVSRALAAWDRFNHQSAREILLRYRPILGRFWGPLLGTLDLMENPERGEPMRLFDLWRNAERRAAQGRYDDAVARTYRLLEWSAQWILQIRADIATNNVPEDKIPPGIELTRNRQGQYQAGLFNAWRMAENYGGEAVAAFWHAEEQNMLDLLKSRNHSILAHGFEPISSEHWQAFARWVSKKLLPPLLTLTAEEPYRIKRLPEQLPTALPQI